MHAAFACTRTLTRNLSVSKRHLFAHAARDESSARMEGRLALHAWAGGQYIRTVPLQRGELFQEYGIWSRNI